MAESSSSPEDRMERLLAFRLRSHSLRLYASRIAALAGFNPFACLPDIMMNLVYQGGRELFEHDASLLGIEIRSDEEILMELAAKASESTTKALKSALDVKKGKHVLDTVHIADQVKQKVLEEAKNSKKLNPEEMKVLQEGVRSSVDTGYGTFHEEEALNLYEKQCGWEVRNRNASVMAWPFAKTEEVHSDRGLPQTGQPTVVPLSKASEAWKKIESPNDEKNTKGDVVVTEGGSEDIEGTENSEREPNPTLGPLQGPELTAVSPGDKEAAPDRDVDVTDVIDTEKKDLANVPRIDSAEKTASQDAPGRTSHIHQLNRPFFTIFGSVDGIRDELWCPPNDLENESSFDEDWSLRQIIVECKHRMKKTIQAPPLYDQIQTTAYCLMYEVDEADIVQVVRNAESPSARKKQKTCDSMTTCEDQPRVEDETKETDGAQTSADTNVTISPVNNDISGGHTSHDEAGAIAEDEKHFKETVTSGNVKVSLGGESTINTGCEDDKASSEGSKNPESSTGRKTSRATVEINVKRVSLDDPVMQHRQNWHAVVLPRLRSFVEAVYRIRADDNKRYRLLSSMSNPSGNGEAWNILHEECPWLKDCDTAFHRDY